MTAALRIIDLVTTDEGNKFEPAGRMAAAIIEVVQAKADMGGRAKSRCCLPPSQAAGFLCA